jgi:AraC-like DNA-binding protein
MNAKLSASECAFTGVSTPTNAAIHSLLSHYDSGAPVLQKLCFVISELLDALNEARRSDDGCTAARIQQLSALVRQDHTLRYLVIPDQPGGADLRVKSGLSRRHMRLLTAHIDTHLERRITNQELADVAKLSVPHFCRIFKKSFGSPPHLYMMHLRIGRARKLMWTTRTSLTRIAVTCGFADQAHFCKVFRRYEGETPAAWRRSRVFLDPEDSDNLRPELPHPVNMLLPDRYTSPDASTLGSRSNGFSRSEEGESQEHRPLQPYANAVGP